MLPRDACAAPCPRTSLLQTSTASPWTVVADSRPDSSSSVPSLSISIERETNPGTNPKGSPTNPNPSPFETKPNRERGPYRGGRGGKGREGGRRPRRGRFYCRKGTWLEVYGTQPDRTPQACGARCALGFTWRSDATTNRSIGRISASLPNNGPSAPASNLRPPRSTCPAPVAGAPP